MITNNLGEIVHRTAIPALACVAVTALIGCLAGCGGSSKATGAATPMTSGQASTIQTAASSPSDTQSSSASQSATKASGPCGYATVAELTAIFGGTVSPGAMDTAPDAVNPTCKWTVTGASLGSGDIVIALPVALQDATKFGYAKTGLAATSVDVPGVGDSAFYTPLTFSVNLLKGNTALLVQAVFGAHPDAATIKSEVIALAGKVAAEIN